MWGRPPKITDMQKDEARRPPAEGATLKELAQRYDVGLAAISRYVAGAVQRWRWTQLPPFLSID
jgi:hypothetical protein